MRIALIGNPNAGKTTLFNALTGLNRKIANYPGVTVKVSQGTFTYQNQTITLIDFPGTYSIYPTSKDEHLVENALLKQQPHIDAVVVIAEATQLQRALILLSQVLDLGYPALLLLNKADLLPDNNLSLKKLEEYLQVPILLISARNLTTQEKEQLKKTLVELKNQKPKTNHFFTQVHSNGAIKDYRTWIQKATQAQKYKDVIDRYYFFASWIGDWKAHSKQHVLTDKIDKVLLHPFWGYGIFFGLLFLIFQALFHWAQIPMEWIDVHMALFAQWLHQQLPQGLFNELLTQGLIPGIAGVAIFIPQIALLFLFLGLLEEVGYMSRAAYLMERWLRPLGLSGKSLLPLLSGVACAVPAILSTRTIEHWKERLITILVIPLITCSARLPVYIMVIALIIPNKTIFGLFHLQGFVLFLMYVLGITAALSAAALLKRWIPSQHPSYFVMEMPHYQLPKWSNLFYTVWDHTKAFLVEAGKIIVALSILLWFLGSYNWQRIKNPQQAVAIEESFLGTIGTWIEPVIRPLGYDWKIGIALLSSFAAREVFVSTLATLYSIEEDASYATIKERLAKEYNPYTGKKVFNFATGVSLLLFYAFALQCMSTLAVIRSETLSWRWTIGAFLTLFIIAYLFALIAYQILSRL